MIPRLPLICAVMACFVGTSPAAAQEASSGLFSGTWNLTVGAEVFRAPRFTGSSDYMLFAKPLVSLGKAGTETRFSSRNDNISLAFIDKGSFRAGAVGKFLLPYDPADEPETAGLSEVPFGFEAGGFAEIYPTDWLRVRGEVRHAIGGHEGIAADIAADAFFDITPEVRVSGGPRVSWGNSKYFDAYYGVTAAESAATGLAVYDPDGGIATAGAGGAITFKATDRLTVSAFGEYSRLVGSASRSSLVEQRGSKNQFVIGLSTTYRFDFDL